MWSPLALPALLLLGYLTLSEARSVDNCFQYGSGGWDLLYWGDPNVRLPAQGFVVLCGTPDPTNVAFGTPGMVLFRWRDRQGVCLIKGDPTVCPAEFTEQTCETLIEVADSNVGGTLWPNASVPAGTYWVTSPEPGACEAGVKLRIDVVPRVGYSSAARQGGSRLSAALAAAAALAFLLT